MMIFFKFVIYLSIVFYNFSLASGIDKLNNFNQNNNSIVGEFTQKTINSHGIKNTHGQFSILRPKYFKWEYYDPYSQLIIADGENIWLYDKDLSQVVKQKQQGALDSSPASILSNSYNLHKNYYLLDDGKKANIEYIKAIPKVNDSTYKYIKIGMKNNLIYSIYLKDSFGNNVEIILKKIHNNNKLKPQDFIFAIPKDVDILDN